MQVTCKNKRLERVLVGANVLTAALVVASLVLLYGFDIEDPPLPAWILFSVQVALLCAFIAEKVVRLFNSVSKAEFWRANWFEVPLLLGLAVAAFGSGYWFDPPSREAGVVRHFAVGIYLVLQVIAKLCRTSVNLAASGKNPTQTLVASFLVLITSGAGLLMLPTASAQGKESLGLVDALFTATSATCVTGLIVKDTGEHFSLIGQAIILILIQLGGLGIVVFGAVFALLLRQVLNVREQVAMQDLLSAGTLSKIGNMITFIIVGTIIIETVGAIGLIRMWSSDTERPVFYSIFHSISAFCNAGFSLHKDSFIAYDRSWQIYGVICPLIILGGLGFSVLYDLVNILTDRIKRFFKKRFYKQYRLSMEAPKRMRLQTKIVLSVSVSLIILGTLGILLFERHASPGGVPGSAGVLDALFQSITARTAGFNTVDISAMSPSSRFIVILLMFIGGSPGSTAGGIKTVTLAVVVMTAIAALRKRQEVEMFQRSVRIVVVGRAITVTLLFAAVLLVLTLALSISENSKLAALGFDMSDIAFEAASALGTVGLTTGITPLLTTAGKLIIIAAMLIGRLGPLTLLAALTFNLRPAKYNYPDEAIMVG